MKLKEHYSDEEYFEIMEKYSKRIGRLSYASIAVSILAIGIMILSLLQGK